MRFSSLEQCFCPLRRIAGSDQRKLLTRGDMPSTFPLYLVLGHHFVAGIVALRNASVACRHFERRFSCRNWCSKAGKRAIVSGEYNRHTDLAWSDPRQVQCISAAGSGNRSAHLRASRSGEVLNKVRTIAEYTKIRTSIFRFPSSHIIGRVGP